MSTAAAIAIETDRLVTGTRSRIAPRHGERLTAMAAEIGIPQIGALPAIDEELLSGPMPYAFIGLRLQYSGPEVAYAQVDDLVAIGLLERDGAMVVATDTIKPLLAALSAARDETMIWSFGTEMELIERLSDACRRVTVDAPGELLDLSRHVTEPEHPSARLGHRLMKVRYVRHQCHMDVWRSAGFEAAHMPPFTALWRGREIEPSTDLDLLIERGLAADATALTEEGRSLRDQIERDTNERAQAVFDRVLTAQEQAAFVADLRALELVD